MKTIKIIDLLNEIANGEEVPEKIKYNSEVFIFNENYKRYINDDLETLGEFLALDLVLNDEVEIIEEKIEKIPVIIHKNDCKTVDCDALQYKIDELIDAVNEIRRGN